MFAIEMAKKIHKFYSTGDFDPESTQGQSLLQLCIDMERNIIKTTLFAKHYGASSEKLLNPTQVSCSICKKTHDWPDCASMRAFLDD